MYTAAIDIGSNAIRLAIARPSEQSFHISYRSRQPVRLGSSVFRDGAISQEVYEDLKEALFKFRNQLENHKVTKLRAIATSAMREASNGAEVLRSLLKETKIPIELISGEEEARLVNLAISKKMDLSQGDFLLIDIGGGSIELIASSQGKVLKKQSYVLGMVRVLELQKKKKQKLNDWLPTKVVDEMSHFFKDLPPLPMSVGTGGNMDRFIKLKPFVSNEAGISLSFQNMGDLYSQLQSVDYNKRIAQFSLKPDRADVIIPAAITTLKLMELAQSQEISFPQVGIKDGILYELSSPTNV